jgi:sporulation protein YlmC with PRC-barrel domain
MDEKVTPFSKTSIKEDNKMKKLTTFIAAVAMMAFASPLYAAGDAGTTTESGQPGSAQVQSPDELKGMQVVSQTGEKLGKIDSVKTDPQSGQIRFVTITKGGVLGMGGEDIAVPLEAFRIDQQNQRATLTVNESMLDNAPQQANMSDDEFQRNLEQHYGVAPAWKGDSKKMGTDPSQMGTDPSQPMEQQPGMGTTPQSN